MNWINNFANLPKLDQLMPTSNALVSQEKFVLKAFSLNFDISRFEWCSSDFNIIKLLWKPKIVHNQVTSSRNINLIIKFSPQKREKNIQHRRTLLTFMSMHFHHLWKTSFDIRIVLTWKYKIISYSLSWSSVYLIIFEEIGSEWARFRYLQ